MHAKHANAYSACKCMQMHKYKKIIIKNLTFDFFMIRYESFKERKNLKIRAKMYSGFLP